MNTEKEPRPPPLCNIPPERATVSLGGRGDGHQVVSGGIPYFLLLSSLTTTRPQTQRVRAELPRFRRCNTYGVEKGRRQERKRMEDKARREREREEREVEARHDRVWCDRQEPRRADKREAWGGALVDEEPALKRRREGGVAEGGALAPPRSSLLVAEKGPKRSIWGKRDGAATKSAAEGGKANPPPGACQPGEPPAAPQSVAPGPLGTPAWVPPAPLSRPLPPTGAQHAPGAQQPRPPSTSPVQPKPKRALPPKKRTPAKCASAPLLATSGGSEPAASASPPPVATDSPADHAVRHRAQAWGPQPQCPAPQQQQGTGAPPQPSLSAQHHFGVAAQGQPLVGAATLPQHMAALPQHMVAQQVQGRAQPPPGLPMHQGIMAQQLIAPMQPAPLCMPGQQQPPPGGFSADLMQLLQLHRLWQSYIPMAPVLPAAATASGGVGGQGLPNASAGHGAGQQPATLASGIGGAAVALGHGTAATGMAGAKAVPCDSPSNGLANGAGHLSNGVGNGPHPRL